MEAITQEECTAERRPPNTRSDFVPSPKATIGIPAYNEKGNIGPLLRELLSQVSSSVIEIIVSDDGSNDGTSSEVLRVAGKQGNHKCAVKLIEAKRRSGKATAVDKILKLARGEIIVLIDADAQIEEGCVDKIIKPFSEDKKIGVTSGNILPLNSNDESKLFSYMSCFQRELNDQLCRRLVNENLTPKVNGAFFAFRRDVVDHIPNSVVSDDEYISWRAQKQGYKATYVSGAKVYAKDPVNIRDYISKRRRILGGHFLIRNTLNYEVPTTRIDLLLPELGRLMVKHWKRISYLSTMIFLECLCRPLAFSDVVRGKVSPRYRVESAKSVSRRGQL